MISVKKFDIPFQWPVQSYKPRYSVRSVVVKTKYSGLWK